MEIKRRVFVSVPADDYLSDNQKNTKRALLKKISDSGYEPQIFLFSGLPKGLAWTFTSVSDVMRRCYGAVILGLPRWKFRSETGEIKLPTEYNHYEGALANTLRIPILTIAERGMVDRGILWTGGGNPILFMPEDADVSWLDSESFRHRFDIWLEQVSERQDIFLGYCSKAQDLANQISLYLSREFKMTINDWALDFSAGRSILEEIENAATRCSCGIFLFTNDDQLEGSDSQASPRDNVLFEAGYFISAKGQDRVLIIREAGSKMPADLGGNIYIHLKDRGSITPIHFEINKFIKRIF